MHATADRETLDAAAKEAAGRTIDLLDSLSVSDSDRRVPGMDWTVAEVGAHLVTLYGRALGDMRRSATPDETAVLNAACIAELEERDLSALANRLRGETPVVFDQVLASLPDDLQFPFHAGATTTVVPVLGVLLLEFLVHGDDIARATGASYAIPAVDAALAMEAAAPLLVAWLTPEARTQTSRFVFALDEIDTTFTFVLGDGSLTLETEAGHSPGGTTIAAPALLRRVLGRDESVDPVVERFAALFEAF